MFRYYYRNNGLLTLCWHGVDAVLTLCWRCVDAVLTLCWRSVDAPMARWIDCSNRLKYSICLVCPYWWLLIHEPWYICLHKFQCLGIIIEITACWRPVDGLLTQCWRCVDAVLTLCWRCVDAVLTLCWRTTGTMKWQRHQPTVCLNYAVMPSMSDQYVLSIHMLA